MSRLLERALLIVGLVCLGWVGFAAAVNERASRAARAEVEQVLNEEAAIDAARRAATPADAATSSRRDRATVAARRASTPPRGRVVGMLEIPRLGLSTPIVEGDDSAALRGAAGHLSDTPAPWEPGNSAVAAHRDGIFRPLRHIRIGDELRVETQHGVLRYRVHETRIVVPTDLSVLEPTSERTLTLITCYPFNYIGSAPKRFVVQARRISPDQTSDARSEF